MLRVSLVVVRFWGLMNEKFAAAKNVLSLGYTWRFMCTGWKTCSQCGNLGSTCASDFEQVSNNTHVLTGHALKFGLYSQ